LYVPEVLELLEHTYKFGLQYPPEEIDGELWNTIPAHGLLQWKVKGGLFSLMVGGHVIMNNPSDQEEGIPFHLPKSVTGIVPEEDPLESIGVLSEEPKVADEVMEELEALPTAEVAMVL